MKLRPITVTAFLIILLNSLAFGGSDANASYAGAYLRMGLGARATAMGNSGVALPRDGFAVYYNPAGIPLLSRRTVALSYSFLTLDRQMYYTGVTVPVHPTAGVGVGWLHAGIKNIEGRTSTGLPDEIYATGEDVFILSFANAFHRRLSFGLNFKILRQQLVDLTATGLGFDFGILLVPLKELQLGVQFKDIGANYTWNTQKLFDEKGSNYREAFPQTLKIGLAFMRGNDFNFVGDLEISDKHARQAHFGAEYNYHDLAFLRMGMNNRNLTFGAGLAYGFLLDTDTQLDYCLVVGAVGEGITHVFSWQFRF